MAQVPYIWYSVIFKDLTEALLVSKSEINVINQACALQLSLKIRKTNIRAQKIDGVFLESYDIVVSAFSMSNKDDRERFFDKSFLLADVKPDPILEISFLTISNADIDFQAGNL